MRIASAKKSPFSASKEPFVSIEKVVPPSTMHVRPRLEVVAMNARRTGRTNGAVFQVTFFLVVNTRG
jgi:hypothetical protein